MVRSLLTVALAWFTCIQLTWADPEVAISAPADNARFSASASIGLTAAALAPGQYPITAVATNSAGIAATSAPVAAAPREIGYAYDAAGRLTNVSAPDGASSQYIYDAVGNLLSIKKSLASSVWIAGFSPAVGSAGNPVTLYGGGFGAAAAENTVTFNGAKATVLAATPTSLSVIVPDAASTGKLTVSNAAGTATSASDFIIASLDPNGSSTIVKVGANGAVSFGFSANAGDGLSLALSSVATVPPGGAVSVVLKGPNGSSLKTCSAPGPKLYCLLPYLPSSGRYTVTVSADGNAATASLKLVPDERPGSLTLAAAPVRAAIVMYGQAATYTFEGAAGQDNLNLALSRNYLSGTAEISVYQPDGPQWVAGTSTFNPTDTLTLLNLSQVPKSGTYKVRIVPGSGATGSISAALTQDVRGTVVIDGAATAVTLAGQKGRFTFSGTAGQWLGLGVTGLSTTPSGMGIWVRVLKPDGTQLVACQTSAASSSCLLPALPVSGAYTVLVDLGSGSTTKASLSLLLTSDASGNLVANGSSQTFASTRVGQAATYSFGGTAQQNLALVTSDDTFPGYTYVNVYRPDGTQLASGITLYNSGTGTATTLALSNLPMTGTYRVRIVPPSGTAGSITAALLEDVTGTVAIDGAATAVTLAGQKGRFTFAGTAGQWLGLGITGLSTTPAGMGIWVSVVQPDGTQLVSCQTYAASSSCIVPVLPVSGIYTVLVELSGSSAASASLNLLLSSDASGTLVANGSSQTFTSTRVGQAASYSFNGSAQQNLALVTSGDTFPGYTFAYVYQPNGTQLTSGITVYNSGAGTGAALALPNLPVTGPYRVRIVPTSATVGSITAALLEDVTGTVAIDGAATAVTLAGQKGRFSFAGRAGQWLGLGITGLSTTPAGAGVTVSVLQPDGSQLVSCPASVGSSSCILPALPVSGTYTVLVELRGSSAASASLNLLLTSDASGTLVVNGSSQTFTSTRVGQAASYSFNGSAQQNLALVTSDDTFPGYTLAYVYQPNGTQLASGATVYNSGTGIGGTLALSNLPVTGPYRVRIVPTSATAGSITAALLEDVAGTVAIDGAATTVTLAGQKGRFTFAGTAGQWLGLGITGLSTTPSGMGITVSVLKPDGRQLVSCPASAASSSCILPALPVSGTYTVLVELNGSSAAGASLNLLLTSDASGTLVANGSSQTFTSIRVGQAASYSFNGSAQQNLALVTSGDTFPGYTFAYVYQPNGTQLASGITLYNSGAGTGATLALSNLPVTGPYRVRIVPTSPTAGSITAALLEDVTGTVAIDGAATTVTLAGQKGRFSFAGTAGQWLGLGITGLSTTPAGAGVTVSVLQPDGSQLVSCPASAASSSCILPALPVSGTYTVLVELSGSSAAGASLNLLLTSDASGTLVPNGSSQTFTSTRVGQAASYSFNGSAQQNLALVTSGDTFPGYTFAYVYQPNGTQLASGITVYNSGAGTGAALALSNLPVTGPYRVRIVPPSATAGSITAALLEDVTGTVAIDGAATTVTLAGQKGRFTFAGTAGQWLGLGITGLSTTPSGMGITVSVLKPDGRQLVSCPASAASSSCIVPVLPVSGTYTVLVELSGSSAASASLNLLLSSDASGTLVANGSSQTFTSTRVGQAASYSFNGSAQQNLALVTSGDTFPGYTFAYVYQPNGAQLASGITVYNSGAGTGATLALSELPVTGPYRVRIVPTSPTAGSITAALLEDVTGTVAIDGAATTVTLAGQKGRFSFSGTAGQWLGLGITGLSTTPSGMGIWVSVVQPNGSQLVSCPASAASSSCILPALPVSGTYTVLVDLSGSSATNASLSLQLTSDASGTLVPNGSSQTFTSTRVGQAASYSFNGSAQQNLALVTSGDTFPGYTFAHVYQPNGTQLISGITLYNSGTGTGATLALSNLPVTGPYRVRIVPPSATAGSITTALLEEVNGTVAIDGPPTAVTLAGQKARFSFAGAAGQWLGLGITGLSTNVTVSVLKPDGTQLVSCPASTASSSCLLPALPVSGTYTVLVELSGSSAASASLSLLLTSDASGTLAVNGSGQTFTSTRVGQAASYSFNGSAQQNLALVTSGDTFPGNTYAYVYRPDGSQLAASITSYSSGAGTASELALSNLPVTGPYRVRIVPPSGTTGSITAGLTEGITGTVAIDGAATAVTLTGQNGRLTFSGTAGQWLGLGITGLSTTPSGTGITVSVLKPDGASLVSCSPSAASSSCALPVLPASGIYSVRVNLGSATKASLNLQLTSDVIGALVVNGNSQKFTSTRIGQAASYSFNGSVQQSLALAMSGDTFPGYTYAYVYRPDGTQLASGSAYYSSGAGTAATLTLSNLPVSGPYRVRIVPDSGTTGSIWAALEGATGTVVIDGAATEVTLAGQSGRVTFAGTAGQWLGLGITGLSTSPSGKGVKVSILKPDGTSLVSCSPIAANSSCTMPVLPSSGTYTVLVSLGSGATAGSLNLLLSGDANGALDVNGSSRTFTSTRVGQAATYSFNGTAGQPYLNLQTSGNTFVGTTQVFVYKPDGAQLTSGSSSHSSGAGTAASLSLPGLPLTGTYLVRIVPASGTIGGITAALTQDLNGTLALDGAATAVSLTGQSARFAFPGTAGQWLGLGVTGLSTMPSGKGAKVSVLRPDGASLVSCSPTVANSSCTLPVLPSSGTYTVLVSLGSGATAGALGLLLTSDASAALDANAGSLTFTSSRVGQAASFSVSGVAGQQDLNVFTARNTFPGTTQVYVYKPDGTRLASGSSSYSSGPGTTATLSLPALPVTGTYLVRIVPPSGATGGIVAALTRDVSGTLDIDAASTEVSLTGQEGSYTFAGTAGQWLGLGMTGLSTTPSAKGAKVSVLKPDGTTLVSCSATATDSSCPLPVLPGSGTYTVLVNIGAGATSASLALSLTGNASGTLAVNGSALTFTGTRVGQGAAYTFSGTARQVMKLVTNGDTFPGTTYAYVYKPDGTQLARSTTSYSRGAGTGATLTLPLLPITGTYTVRIVPPSGTTGSITARLSQ